MSSRPPPSATDPAANHGDRRARVRACTDADIPAIRRILERSWREAYGAFIPEHDLREYLRRTYAPASLRALHRAAGVQAFAGTLGGRPVAYARTQHRPEEQRLYLSSLYVLPSRQGTGLGGALLARARLEATRQGLDQLWVGVMSANHRAVRWYEARGFRFVREEPFTMIDTTVPHRIGFCGIECQGGTPSTTAPR
jgi:ribosomal protein S18 acetylase RimI-like enzyme